MLVADVGQVVGTVVVVPEDLLRQVIHGSQRRPDVANLWAVAHVTNEAGRALNVLYEAMGSGTEKSDDSEFHLRNFVVLFIIKITR